MPLYDFVCPKCDHKLEVIARMDDKAPTCCGEVMNRLYGNVFIKIKYPLWVDRISEIHKAQESRGERLRMVFPREVF